MSKPLWRIVLLTTGLFALWWGCLAGLALWHYARLGPEISAHIERFELVPKGSQYALKATYSYQYNQKNYVGGTLFSKPYHLNRVAAEKEIQKLSDMQWIAWVDADHPAYSSLEKKFPFKKTFYAACLLAVFLYFVYLKFHLELI